MCLHEWEDEAVEFEQGNKRAPVDLDYPRDRSGDKGVPTMKHVTRSTCLRCSAWRGSLGLEPTIDLYVAHLVEIFRLVRDLLADDGTVWLNLGDSYAGGGGFAPNAPSNSPEGRAERGARDCIAGRKAGGIRPVAGLKPKDLVGIPWRVAFALQADGWWLRSDIIWSKPNPMPESVTDRPTKAHEYLFLLTKRATYFYDAESIREPVSPNWSPSNAPTVNELGAHVLTNGQRGHQRRLAYDIPKGANRRSVWTIATTPYPDAHFATFPEDLVKPCILAGSRPGDVILDPFMGSGTVAKVAQDLGRQWLGCELSGAYGAMVNQRTKQGGLVLGT